MTVDWEARFAAAAASSNPSEICEDDPRLVGALEEFLQQLEAGERPDRRLFSARFPELAPTLSECLESVEMVRHAAPQFDSGERIGSAPWRLGEFRVVREIGRGGTGVVYEAIQSSFGRRVALKVLPPSLAIDDRQRRRFQIEAQAAALLQHERIVPIHSVGCDQGVPYYAMPLIEGRSLANCLDDLRRPHLTSESTDAEAAAANPESLKGKCLGIGEDHARWAAALARQAAEGLAHAHALGIVHRDIKPSNLLLDRDGKLWITDFGLARLAGDPRLTRSGDLAGALRYMSPEQAAGRLVDHRADIYALGCTLYELLTLRPALRGRERQELLHQIEHREPISARALEPALSRDLETIVCKAIAKEPSSRYPSAHEFSEDLRRYLADEPIRARRPTLREQSVRLARRHRRVVAASGVMCLFVLVGSVTGSIAVGNAYRAEARQRMRAEANLQLSMRALDQLANRISALRLHGDRADVSEDRKLIEDTLRFCEEFVKQNQDDPTVRQWTAAAFGRVADIRAEFGQVDASRNAYRRAIQLFEQLVVEHPFEPSYRIELATAWQHLGNMLRRARQLQEAERSQRHSLRIRREIAALHPKAQRRGRECANSLTELGAVLVESGRYDEAGNFFRDALKIQQPLIAGNRSPDPEILAQTADTYHKLGTLMILDGEPVAGERALERALSIRVELAAQFPEEPKYQKEEGVTRANLGVALQKNGKRRDAESQFVKAKEILTSVTHTFPRLRELRHELARSHLHFACYLAEQKRVREAEAAATASLALLEELCEPKDAKEDRPRHLAVDLERLSELFEQLHHPREAEAALRTSLACDPNRRETSDLLASLLDRRVMEGSIAKDRSSFAAATPSFSDSGSAPLQSDP
jgi:eukaryotic-like serine/threonine-protein kinase